MFDPTTRLQAARLHGEDLHRSARAHHSPHPHPRWTGTVVPALRRRAHHVVDALRSPTAAPCPTAPRPALDR